jgi:ABC-type branched-subunit amino acid transport system substrate-binding protein
MRLTQERFNHILEDLPTTRKKVLELFLKGYDDSEIALTFSPKRRKGTIRSNIFFICDEFNIEKDNENDGHSRREKLIKLFCKFKRSLLIPPLFDELTNINSNFYLQPGIEYFDRQEYAEAIEMFEKAKQADPKDPIVQIYLNNAIAYLQGKTLKIAVVIAYQNDFYRDAADNVLRGVADAQTKFNDAQSKLNQNDDRDRPLLEVMIANDRNDPRTAKRVAEILCLDPDILGVIGHHSSEGTQAALAVYKENNIAIISPTSTSSNLQGNVFFRTVGSTKVVANTYADYIIDNLDCKEVVICYHDGNAYSQTIKEDCEEAFRDRGINIVDSKPIEDSHLDLDKFIKSISKGTAKVILVLSSIFTNPVALALARENLRLGSRLDLLFSTAMSEKLTLYRGANAIENVALISPNIPENSVYTQNSKSRWGQSKLDWRVATSYDAAQALLAAIKLSKQLTRMEILQNLNGLKLDIDQTSGCGLEFSTLDNSNILVKYRIDRISIQ